ncbi:(E2-independent) E3 ubiquitin-conjugating enzyme FATS [Betta splendens]|uniref:(E2-independent) E3 ubiquitin-conjugating enzyme FATS n=1 Tax=Betta splendens TaxID=158456 RepID=A0A6P7L9X0_BETSP|nr:(E2-independent) E3 ubiquitin-conjugating enzyme FATS [Betta splendens]XP_028991392.1 (E2-independent) E3 ubiquitin-conjugating enzyme FATS [Betta splendens]XP_028991394.1 (E2-independent) E3 ubiquitin-conjugating enzyme FATS [Betta splendens]XP_028991395.1 (E2-independent) E3 ubiquitin-conjugating enzyme FATS [Betta splendens]
MALRRGAPEDARLPRAPRPRSAVDGRQLDAWLEHPRGLRGDPPAGPGPRAAWPPGTPPLGGRSSSCGSCTQCGSLESLHSGLLAPPEARGSWERARLVQAARKQQPQISGLSQVRTGWLPVQSRVTVVSDPSVGQVKVKQPITPVFQRSRAPPTAEDGDAERRRAGRGSSGAGTPPDPEQRPENRWSPATEGDRPVSWQVLRRGWNSSRGPVSPGGPPATEPPDRKTAGGPEPLRQAAAAPPWSRRAPPPGPSAADALQSQTAFNGRSGVLPVRATAPLCTTNTQTSSAAFSSLTVSSRKVGRSASLPGDADPPGPRVTVRRGAAIAEVEEQRVTRGAARAAADAVVLRRKATVIKVSERGQRCRHSYTEGVSADSGTWSGPQLNAGPQGQLESTQRQQAPPRAPPRAPPAQPGPGGTVQRSTLRIVLSHPSPSAAPPPPEAPPEAVGRRSVRPLSWYGAGAGHAAPPPGARKCSLDLPPEPSVSGLTSSGAGRPVGDNTEAPGSRAPPCLTLIEAPDPRSRQTPEEVLALNAAAIIANIKLQRQLSKKTTQPETERTSPQGEAVTDERKSPDGGLSRPPAGLLDLGPEGSPAPVSLQEALQRSRPDFVARSQCRVRELERRSRERRESGPRTGAVEQRWTRRGRAAALKENALNPSDGAGNGGEMQLGSKRLLEEVTGKKEDEQKSEPLLSNRQKVALFRKKLLDHLLQRSNS